MKHLQTIQKSAQVFQILVKVAKILCIVGASLCAAGALCAVTWHNGGQILSIFGEPIEIFTEGTDLKQKSVELLYAVVTLTANAVLLAFASGYLKTELAEGTPFTEKGAKKLQNLGIRCIYIPMVAAAVGAVIRVCLGSDIGYTGNLPSVATGIMLIFVSIVFRYGADLEQKVQLPEHGNE